MSRLREKQNYVRLVHNVQQTPYLEYPIDSGGRVGAHAIVNCINVERDNCPAGHEFQDANCCFQQKPNEIDELGQDRLDLSIISSAIQCQQVDLASIVEKAVQVTEYLLAGDLLWRDG
jgi:hypothetical protein